MAGATRPSVPGVTRILTARDCTALPAWATPHRWAVTRAGPVHMGRWIWQATSRSGSTTGGMVVTTASHRIGIRLDRTPATLRWPVTDRGMLV